MLSLTKLALARDLHLQLLSSAPTRLQLTPGDFPLYESFTSQLISVTAAVHVKVVMSGTCVSHPEVVIPITVVAPQRPSPQVQGIVELTEISAALPVAEPGGSRIMAASYVLPMERAILGDGASAPQPAKWGSSSMAGAAGLLFELNRLPHSQSVVIERLAADQARLAQLGAITAGLYAELVASVADVLDQCQLARMLALAQGTRFSCAFVGATLQRLINAPFERRLWKSARRRGVVEVVRAIAPFCQDLASNRALIERQLTEFEVILCTANLLEA